MASLPKTFRRAAFLESGGPLVTQEVEMIQPSKGEVLVKVEACGVCHSDKFAQINYAGTGFPFVPGHELIGRVVGLGEGVEHWKVGDRIGGPWHGGHDGTCKACKKGLFQMCDNRAVNGITRNGGYAEYCTLRSEAGVRVPEHIDAAKYSPILCAGVTVFNGIRRLNVPPGGTVAVHGLGGLGHLAVQYVRKMGYHTVAMSRGTDKEQFAYDLGAHKFIDTTKFDAGEQLDKMGGADLIVSTAPNAEAIQPLIKGLGLLGKLLVVAVPSSEVPVNIGALLAKGCSVSSWPSGHAIDSEETIQFTEAQSIDCMIEKFPLEKAQDAFEHMINNKARFRSVLVMN